ncbi:MAG: hypothetical protein AAF598_10610 [Bacteroidota bacterium]
MRLKRRPITYLKVAIFLFLDFSLYIILGLGVLNYEDWYDEADGPYWSLQSMDLIDKAFYIGYHIWIVFHAVLVLMLIVWVLRRLRTKLFGN